MTYNLFRAFKRAPIALMGFFLLSLSAPAMGIENLTRSCNAGNTKDCVDLGEKYYFGAGVKQDHAKSVELFGRACDGGNISGCNNLGMMYYGGQGVKQDYAKAAELFGRACDGGNISRCNNLGMMYREGKGVKQDYVKATELFGRACNDGNMFGCNNLGWSYQEGIGGVKQDYAKAVELYGRACDGGNMDGCSDLGWMYRLGKGVEQNYAKAAEFFGRACDSGIHVSACNNLDEMYKEGKIVKQDDAKGAEEDPIPLAAGSFVWDWKGKSNDWPDKTKTKGARFGPLYSIEGTVLTVMKPERQLTPDEARGFCENSSFMGLSWRAIQGDEAKRIDRISVTLINRSRGFDVLNSFLSPFIADERPETEKYAASFYRSKNGIVKNGIVSWWHWRGHDNELKIEFDDYDKNRNHQYGKNYVFYPMCVLQPTTLGKLVKAFARHDLMQKCAASSQISPPQKTSISLVRGEFEKTSEFEARQKKEEAAAEEQYRKAHAEFLQAQKKADAVCAAEIKRNEQGYVADYAKIVTNAIWGGPRVTEAKYDADAEVFDIRLQGSEVGRFAVRIPVNIKYAEDFKKLLLNKDFLPTVHMIVENDGTFRVNHVEEFQAPEDRAINAAFAAAQGNVDNLRAFIRRYPKDKRAAQAQTAIHNIEKADERAHEALAELLFRGIHKVREGITWSNEHCRTHNVYVDGKHHSITECD